MGFGKSSQKSNSVSTQASTATNQAYPVIQEKLVPQVDNAAKGNNAIMDLLGLNGAQASDEGFRKFRESGGYNFIKDEGIKSITGSMAARGLLGSGSALKGLTTYGNNLASAYLDKYLKSLENISDSGIKAGQVVTGAGNTAISSGNSISNSTGSSFNANFSG